MEEVERMTRPYPLCVPDGALQLAELQSHALTSPSSVCWPQASYRGEEIHDEKHEEQLDTSSLLARIKLRLQTVYCAYHAVFHAVSALFALQGKTFTMHRALEASVHRDLVRVVRAQI
jgi:hypothetical protein